MLVLFSGCASLDPIQPGAANNGTIDFTRYLAFGNSTTAGTQSAGLVAKYQRQSYPAQLAAAARISGFEMPLISEPGIPALAVFTSLFPSPVIETLPGLGAPTNTNHPAIYNNLGIPGATVNQLVTTSPLPAPNPFFNIVLRDASFGATALDQAVNFQPTLATVWVGLNDVFGSASQGTDLLMTPTSLFEADFRTIIDAINAASGALVVGNLPGILAIPFFDTIPPFLIDPVTRRPILDGQNNLIPLIGEVQGVPGQLPFTTLVTLRAGPLMAQGIGIPQPFGTGTPLPDSVIVDPTERNNIETRIDEYNTVIDSICVNRNIPVADLFKLLNQVDANGVVFHGDEFTTDYVTGGIFSVDGFHPASPGYHIIALEFIKVINNRFGAAIPDPPFPIGPAMSSPSDLNRHNSFQYALGLSPNALDGLYMSLGVDPEDVKRTVFR